MSNITEDNRDCLSDSVDKPAITVDGVATLVRDIKSGDKYTIGGKTFNAQNVAKRNGKWYVVGNEETV
jgi:hypothetical protein